MVCEWGMSDSLGTVSYDERNESGQYLGLSTYQNKNYSEGTANKIDAEVFALIEEAHKRALQIVEENRDKVQLMADMLMEFETIDSTDIKKIMDGSWSIDEKRVRVKAAEDLQKKVPPPPPPLPAILPEPGMQPG